MGTQQQQQCDQIIDRVSAFYSVEREVMLGVKRQSHIVKARHVAMYLIRKLQGTSYESIGGLFNRRDHTTALHAVQKIESQITTDDELRQQIAII